MKKVFMGGPFRGDGSPEAKKANVDRAVEWARKFILAEIPFYSPHLNTDRELLNISEDREDYAINVHYHFLSLCDALAVLPGWQDSSGTKGEIDRAKDMGIPIFYLEEENSIEKIKDWLRS